MFTETGNIRIFLDYQSGKLRVETNSMPSDYRPMWTETNSFDNSTDWMNSPYSTEVTDEDLQDSISWFWVDIGAPPRES